MSIFSIIRSLLSDSETPVVFEIGAHHCEDTPEIMKAAGHPEKNVKMYVFEPDPRNIEVIETKIDGFQLLPGAVGNKVGLMNLYLSTGNANGGEDWTGSSSLLEPKNHLSAHPWCKFDSFAEVPVVTLDFFFDFAKLPKIDFIWADIQGAEGAMVQGGQLALKHTKYLYCEYSDHELYEGQMKLDDWMKLLPGKWEIMDKYPHDVLLENKECQTLKR